MDNLWVPWRHAYIAATKPEKKDSCFICAAKNPLFDNNDDRQNLLVKRLRFSLVLLNKYPYNNGHLLICPLDHTGDLAHLDEKQLLSNALTTQHLLKILKELINPDGFNIGMNHGAAAGAGVPGHLHWHIVPRWNGDTNFMPVLSGTKVIVQSLDSLFDLLIQSIEKHPFPEGC